jgi:hypothetical protein
MVDGRGCLDASHIANTLEKGLIKPPHYISISIPVSIE